MQILTVTVIWVRRWWCCFSQLPSDKLDTAKKQVEYITPADTLAEEERRLRQANELVAAQRKPGRPWFTTNVVDHRCVRTYEVRTGTSECFQLPSCMYV